MMSQYTDDLLELDDIYEWKSVEPAGQIFTPRTGHTAAYL